MSDRRRDGPASVSLPIYAICKTQEMQFACRVVTMEIFGCKQCGSTLTVPGNPANRPPQG